MVLFLIIILVLSVVGMCALLGAKHYELSTGNLVLGSARPKVSRFSRRMFILFGKAVPAYVRWQIERAYAKVFAWFRKVLARAVVAIEHWLESVLNRVREKTEAPRAPGEASAFLREVGEYKKKLNGAEGAQRIDEE